MKSPDDENKGLENSKWEDTVEIFCESLALPLSSRITAVLTVLQRQRLFSDSSQTKCIFLFPPQRGVAFIPPQTMALFHLIHWQMLLFNLSLEIVYCFLFLLGQQIIFPVPKRRLLFISTQKRIVAICLPRKLLLPICQQIVEQLYPSNHFVPNFHTAPAKKAQLNFLHKPC